MKAGISKIPCGTMAAATKSGVWSLDTISRMEPMTIPFKLRIKIVRMPSEAPPRKRKMHASKLLKKSLANTSKRAVADDLSGNVFFERGQQLFAKRRVIGRADPADTQRDKKNDCCNEHGAENGRGNRWRG